MFVFHSAAVTDGSFTYSANSIGTLTTRDNGHVEPMSLFIEDFDERLQSGMIVYLFFLMIIAVPFNCIVIFLLIWNKHLRT